MIKILNFIEQCWNKVIPAQNNPSIHSPSLKATENTQGERFISTFQIDKLDSHQLTKERIALGNHGEARVATWLKHKGFTIKATNYHKRFGEIDIIAAKDDVLAFVEVKFRSTHYFNLSEVITPAKQRKIIKTAKAYIVEHNIVDTVYRFDVALLQKQSDKYTLTYMPNAFTDKTF